MGMRLSHKILNRRMEENYCVIFHKILNKQNYRTYNEAVCDLDLERDIYIERDRESNN